MKNNDKLGKNLEKLISLHGEEQRMDAEQKNKIIENLTNNTKIQIPAATHFWRKISIAAIIILVPAILAIYLHTPSEHKIEIPPELASMSIEELVKLNYDSSQNTFDPNIVKYALKQALEKAHPEEVIKIAKSLDSGGLKGSSVSLPPPEHPLEHLGRSITFREVVEESNLFVHARLVSYKLNIEDIIAALVEKEKFSGFEDFSTRFKVTLELEIINCLPKVTFRAGDIFSITTVLFEDQLNRLREDSEYYLAMIKRDGEEPVFLNYFSGVYPIDSNNPVVPEMWRFFADAQDILLFNKTPKPEVIDYWGSRSGGVSYMLSQEYLEMLPNELVQSDTDNNSNEVIYNNEVLLSDEEYFEIRSSLEKFLIDPNNKTDQINRYTNRFQSEENAFKKLGNLPESVRPSHEEMMNYLIQIYERNKENESCRNFTVLTFKEILEPTDTQCLPILSELLLMDKPHFTVPEIIISRMPDHSLVPIIRTAINSNNFDRTSSGQLFEALYACGQEDEAITKSLELLAEPLRADNSRYLLSDLERNAAVVLFLGKTQRTELMPIIEEYTTQKLTKKYKGVYSDLYGFLIDYNLGKSRQNAIMALARLGGKSSVPKLSEIYNTTNDIWAKMVTAVALYYNGDKTGEKLLRHIIEGTYRNVPDLAIRLRTIIEDGTVFQDTVKSYLRNELTDALWLEKLTYYIDHADAEVIIDRDIESEFLNDHRREILRIMVAQLNSIKLETRQYAQEILQKTTGQYFGFDSGRYAGQQEEIIQRWREYLKSIEE